MENFKEEKINPLIDADTKLNYTKVILLVLVSFILVFIGGVRAADAANLFLSPSSGSYQVGKTFSVSVLVSSPNQAMNAAGGIISFSADKLEITSLSKSGSIFSLWVQEPNFSNSAGTINFEGIVLNPGFTGSGGKIMAINFKAKSAGATVLNFSSGSILANDGAGTNILGSLASANYQLSAATVSPGSLLTEPITKTEQITEEKPTATAGVPMAPQVLSSTHPDSNKWYNNKNPQFFWILPTGVNGVSLYLNESPTSNPGPVSDGLFASKSYENISDGIWYFHIKFKNFSGWGPTAHFKIQIDTQPPEPFTIEFVHGKKIVDPSPIITFNTTDALSGVGYYKIKIGNGNFFEIDPNLILSNPYSLPPQAPGKSTVVAQAYDKAENTATAVEEFEILALDAPKITRYQENIVEGDLLEIGGKTYPDSDVDLFLFQEGKKVLEQRVKSNSSGDFTFVWSRRLEIGAYEVQTQVTDNRGAESLPSEKITITVEKSAVFRIGSWVISFLAMAVPLIALIFLLLFMVWYSWHKFLDLRRRLRKEVGEAESALHKAFSLLKDDMRKQIKMLEKTRTKRQLTEEEEKIIKQLEKDLDAAEKFVKKEIEDIETTMK